MMMIFLLLVVVGFLILLVGGCQCPAEMIRFFLVGGFGRDGRLLGILARLTAVLTVARDVAQLQCLD